MSASSVTVLIIRFLLAKDRQGQRNLKKVVAIVCVVGLLLIYLLSLYIDFLLSPLSNIPSFMLPETARELRDAGSFIVNRPVLDTDSTGDFVLPCEISTISSDYGRRRDPITGKRGDFHEGIDFPAPFGTPVVSIREGKVVETGIHNSYGHYVMIQHKIKVSDTKRKTIYSFYAHLSKVYVFEGQAVEMGTHIADSGGDPSRHFAGRSTGSHLHLEIRKTKAYSSHTDPYPILFGLTDWDEDDDE